MSASDVVQQFTELFQGNHAAIGTEDGGCYRHKSSDPTLEWHFGIRAHLDGHNPPIGVYPMVPFPTVRPSETASQVETYRVDVEIAAEWRVRWGCIDFDEGEEESWVHAKNVHLALQTFGIVGWIERSRSKGYHVWLFADTWVEARTMRKALLAACQIVDAPTKEINPKQIELKPGQLGNYVRLPYPAQLMERPNPAPTWRRSMVDPESGSPIDLQAFVSRAYSSRVSKQGLQILADAYVKPQRPIPRRDWTGLPRTRDGIAGFAKWVAQLPEGNRNNGLYWAARECLDQGVGDLEPLVEAGVQAGLDVFEAERTVESARRG